MVNTRRVTLDDLDVLVTLRTELFREMNDQFKKSSAVDDFASACREYFLATLPTGEFTAWVAEEDNRVVSISGLVFCNKPPSDNNLTGKEAYIMNLYTLPEYRSRGIVTLLLEEIIHHIKEEGIEVTRLHTTGIARSIYEKAGFTQVDNEMVLIL